MSCSFSNLLPSSNRSLGASAISVQQVDEEINHMLNLAYKNVEDGFKQLLNYDKKKGEEILNREDIRRYIKP